MTSQNEGQAMSLERFQALVESYGANLAHIPKAERDQAEALLSQSEQAQRLWEEAKRLDALLEAKAALSPSPALMKRLKDIPERAAGGNNVVPFPRHVRAWAPMAAAAALLLGVFTGAQDDEDIVDPSALVLAPDEPSSDDMALSELGALAFGGDLVTELGAFEGELE